MITTDCLECGAGPMDLPGDCICDDCRKECADPYDDDEEDDD